ncbi:hypothetical protein [Streptomyces sp. NPDC057579]|uniref:hypothetical protein n=1 Tax=Streptomyces sp. NPDC057579 TaxID=3346172 RepID=UPI003678C1D1
MQKDFFEGGTVPVKGGADRATGLLQAAVDASETPTNRGESSSAWIRQQKWSGFFSAGLCSAAERDIFGG